VGFSVEPDEGDSRRFRLVGELDLATSETLLASLTPVTEEPGDVSLDLSQLSFIDSSGIRGILILAEALGGRGRLLLLGAVEPVLRTLRLVGIEQAENIQIS
jgi:anti-anti-sigma factor